MKGILYGNFLLNKKWFIAAGIAAVLGTAFCAFFVSLVPDEAGVVATVLQLVVIAIIMEWPGRNLEANIKCRFTDITLAGGITKSTFVTSELLKNVISIGIGLVMCMVMQLAMSVFDKSFFTLETVKLIAVMAVTMGALEWTASPLVIHFKSAEKAGLLMGLIFGFGLVLTMITFCTIFTEEKETFVSGFFSLLSGNWLPLIIVGISAAIYVIFYFVLLSRVKRGDVC